jgi:hypothetical protein
MRQGNTPVNYEPERNLGGGGGHREIFLNYSQILPCSRVISVDMTTRLRAGLPRKVGSTSGSSKRFLYLQNFQTVLGAYLSSYPMDMGTLSSELKWPERESKHSPPSKVKLKNAWSHTSVPYDIMAWSLIKHCCKFTFLPLPKEQPHPSS